MSTTFPVDQLVVRRYVKQLPPRTRGNANAYRSILGQFVRFAAQHHQNDGVSQEALQFWFRHRAERYPEQRILERAWLLDSFLDWLVTEKLIASNPFAQLRETYGEGKRLGIVRALLRPDAETALAALRPVPRFASHLGAVMREHVDLMRALGLRYQKQERDLLRFDRFLQRRVDLAGAPLVVLVDEWTKERGTAQHALDCAAAGKIVAQALARTDPTVKIPTVDPRLRQQAKNAHRRPHIFSEAEVAHLLATAQSFTSRKAPLRPQSLYTMLVLAYCAGLRLGEIVRLAVGDIDHADQTVEIRETKFFKSRRLPVHPNVMAVLRDYLEARRRSGAATEASAALFWTDKTGCGYDYQTISQYLIEVFRRAGLKPASGHIGPHVHDLRHTFAVHRLTAWYREGIDPQSRLPYLATYLGHKNIDSTLVYLTITDEIRQQAGDRFRVFGAKALQAATGGAECQ
jgi:integrase/recombinase XerD